MEEAVVGAVVGATIQVVLQNLLSISMEEISLIRSLKEELEKLKNSFFMIQDLLEDAEMKEITHKSVKRWLKRLEPVAFDADNILDELNYKILCKKMKKGVSCFCSNSNSIVFRHKMAQKIKYINKKLELINREASSFGLQIGLANAHSPIVAPTCLETDSFSLDPVFIGRDDDVSRIVEMLTVYPAEHEFSILPIVGMGGLGKTTLARKVFGNEKIKSHFENLIWVYVSKNFDVMTLLKNIVASLTTESVEFGSREVLLKKLQRDLGSKRYLLVLDDLWNEDSEKWESFINSLAGISSVKGNGIVITTRSATVASIVKTLDIHLLRGLSDDDCWSIIKAKACGEGSVPLEFETMGKNVAGKCQGLPLAAKVIGGLLCGKSKDEWLSIEEKWLSDFAGDGNVVSKILKLSFDHLPSLQLKKCFAYCSVFPKGARIHKEKLIELWMAEGFLETYQSNDMETVGNNFLNLLLQNSLLQVVEKDSYGNITHCNMHDLVHDLASSVLSSRVNGDILDDNNEVRYSIRDESIPLPKEQAKYLRSLFFKGKIFDSMFSHFNCLHVLTLMGDDVKELPSSIGKLIHLRCLDISYTRITCLPDSIGKLYHLQTLRAIRKYEWEMNYLSKLLSTFKYLISLRHLHIPNIELPPEVGRLTSLQTLPYFQVSDEKGRGIVELGSLKNLKGKVEIQNLEKVHGKEEAKSANLIQKPNIFNLKFVWDETREGETNDEHVLDGLQPHPNLKSLEICGFKGRSLPLWTLKMEGLINLIEIRLVSCKGFQEIPMLGHLPHLRSLYLHDLTNVRSISSSFYGLENCIPSKSCNNGVCKETIIVFPALERLELSMMSNLTSWEEAELPSTAESRYEVVAFPCLVYLKVKHCRQLMSFPSHFPYLEELVISYMDSSAPLAICGVKLTSLAKLKIKELVELVSLPNVLLVNNQNLSALHVSHCPNLTHLVPCLRGGGASLRKLRIDSCSNLIALPDDLHTLKSIEVLDIYNCPSLKSIPFPSGGQSQGFISLRRLEIGWCKGLTSLPSDMLESCVLSLERFSLSGLSSLTNLPVVITCLQKMPRLTELAIVNVPRFTADNVSLCSLQELTVGPLSESSDYLSFKENLDCILQGSRSLATLILYGMEHWDTIPDELQHLTALSYLELYDFGIEALPEWLGDVSSLETLILVNCRKLRHLSSREAMQRLTKLTGLFVDGCPLLKQLLIEQQSGDSELPKISHVPFVTVDGLPLSSHNLTSS